MEPAINPDLESATTLDLTPDLMTDIGWDGTLHCPNGSDQSPTVVINGCDSLVPNVVGPYTVFPRPNHHEFAGNVSGGCSITDVFNNCSGSSDFEKCVKSDAKALKRAGALTKQDVKAIADCAKQ